MSSLQPLTGTRGTATATVSAASGQTTDVEICGVYCYPIPASAAGIYDVDDQRLLRVATNTVVPVGSSATVPLTTVMGGARHNALKAGTRLLWDPPIPGIESQSVLATDVRGAADAFTDLFAALQDVTSFEDLAGTNQALQLFKARLQGRVPACVIAWERAEEPEIKARGVSVRDNVWTLFVVVENVAGEQFRRDQGLWLVDAIEHLIHEKRSVDDYVFSDPPATIQGSRRIATTDSSLVYAVEVRTHNAMKRIDLRVDEIPGLAAAPGYEDLEAFRLTAQTVDEDPYRIVDYAGFPNLIDAFSDGFNEGFS